MKLRKAIHISGVLIPLASGFIGKMQVIVLMFAVLAVFLIVEAFKQKISKRYLALFYRENELGSFSIDPLSFFISIISILLVSYFIDEKICFAAIAILAAGDGFADVMGRRFGKRISINNKTWEGTVSGLIAATLAGYYFAGPVAIIGSFAGMAGEATSKHDNLIVAFSALVSMYIAQILFPF